MGGKVEAGRDPGTVSLFQAKALSIWLFSTLPTSDKGLLRSHTHKMHTITQRITHVHKRIKTPGCETYTPNSVEGVQPPSHFYSLLHCLKHLKENVELTFHHCQIMPANYSYFSHSKIALWWCSLQVLLATTYFRTQKIETEIYNAFKSCFCCQ